MNTPVEARPAATVVVLRPLADAFEVLLVRRHDRVAFMAGAFVFPGGRVDVSDRPISTEAVSPPASSRFPDLSPDEEFAHRRAAARELQEEAALSIDAAELIPIAHWVTPEIEIRRYDTRFFLTVLPDGQEARHDDSETTEIAWLTPADALARCLGGQMMLPPPTWTTLRQLERHPTLAAALSWARTTPLVRIQPNFLEEGSTSMLTLPGDPSFPPIEGWTTPEETRFVLEEGRGWLPVRP
jgi:8-oxo-dGTP pyrophosphatase MutT (NUDIX family)